MLMPKPWVGGGWVRADQSSQGRKTAQERGRLKQPKTTMSVARIGDPFPLITAGPECRFMPKPHLAGTTQKGRTGGPDYRGRSTGIYPGSL